MLRYIEASCHTHLCLLRHLFQHVPKQNIRGQLLRLTNRDCEVNAPIQNAGLLQGAELLNALDIEVLQSSQ